MVQLIARLEELRPRDAEAFIAMVIRVGVPGQRGLQDLGLRPYDVCKRSNGHLVAHRVFEKESMFSS